MRQLHKSSMAMREQDKSTMQDEVTVKLFIASILDEVLDNVVQSSGSQLKSDTLEDNARVEWDKFWLTLLSGNKKPTGNEITYRVRSRIFLLQLQEGLFKALYSYLDKLFPDGATVIEFGYFYDKDFPYHGFGGVLKERINDKLIGHYPTSLEYPDGSGAGVVVRRFGPFIDSVKQHFNTTKFVPERLHWACQNTFYCLNKKEILQFLRLLSEHKFSQLVSVDYAPFISPGVYKPENINMHVKQAPAFSIIVEQLIFLAKNQENLRSYFNEEKLYAYIYKPVLGDSPHIEMVAIPDPSSVKEEQKIARKRSVYLVKIVGGTQKKYIFNALFKVMQQINSKAMFSCARFRVEPISSIDLWYQAIIRYAHDLGLATNLVRLVINFNARGKKGSITSALSFVSTKSVIKKDMEDCGCKPALISDIFRFSQANPSSTEEKIGEGSSDGLVFVLKITPGAR